VNSASGIIAETRRAQRKDSQGGFMQLSGSVGGYAGGKALWEIDPPEFERMLSLNLRLKVDSETTYQFEFRGTWRKKCSNVPHRRLAEEAAVFAIELRRAFVADLKSRAGRVETIIQHQAPR